MLGVDNPPNWLQDTTLIYPSLAFIGLWGIGAAVIVNLAGLKGIPTELYDAARIDGAGFWSTLRHVTLPMMSPVIFYSLILGIVDVLQYFLVPLVLYNGTGEPGGSTLFFNLLLYKQAFNFQHYATARPSPGSSSGSPSRSRSSSSGRPGAGSTTPGNADERDRRDRPGAATAADRRPPPALLRAAEGDREVVPADVHRGRRPRGVPLADHPGDVRLAPDARAGRPARRAAVLRPSTRRSTTRARPTTSTTSRSTARSARSRS